MIKSMDKMDATSDQYIDRLCRTCMHTLTEASTKDANTKSDQQWKSVMDTIEEYGALAVAELLCNAVPHVEVQLNDEMPKKICQECLQQLLSFYRFQQMCIQSDRRIRELIARTNANLHILTKITVGDKNRTNDAHSCIAKDVPITNERPSNFQGLFLQQQLSIEASYLEIKERIIEFEPESAQSNATDPLHDDVIDNFKESKGDVGELFKNEQCDDATNAEYNDEYHDALILETEKEQATNLTSSKHICALCQKTFNQLRFLQRHLERHKKWDEQKEKYMQPYRFKCDICNRYFHKAESLHNHRLVHDAKTMDNILVNACDLCEKTYSSTRTLARHKRMRHSTEIPKKPLKQHACDLCEKSFKNSVALRDHVRIHTGERPYLCPECGKSYSTSGNLRQHRLRHGDDKPYECPYCPMRFPCSSGVTNHKKIHAAKQHICDICGVRFAKSDDLKRHRMHHLGEKPYKCEYCDMRFVRMNHQRRHMRTHTGEKPYKCKYCQRAFAQSNDHIKHLRTHLGDNVYRCELCPLAFRLASELRLHFATHKYDDEVARERNMKALREAEAELELKLSANESCQS